MTTHRERTAMSDRLETELRLLVNMYGLVRVLQALDLTNVRPEIADKLNHAVSLLLWYGSLDQ